MADNSLTIRVPRKVRKVIDKAADYLGISRSEFMAVEAVKLSHTCLNSKRAFETRMPENTQLRGPKEMVSISLSTEEKRYIERGAIEHGDTTTQWVIRASVRKADKVIKEHPGK